MGEAMLDHHTRLDMATGQWFVGLKIHTGIKNGRAQPFILGSSLRIDGERK